MPRIPKFTVTASDGSRKVESGYRRIQCFVPERLVKGLKLIAAMDEKPFSDVVGEALSAYLKIRKVKP